MIRKSGYRFSEKIMLNSKLARFGFKNATFAILRFTLWHRGQGWCGAPEGRGRPADNRALGFPKSRPMAPYRSRQDDIGERRRRIPSRFFSERFVQKSRSAIAALRLLTFGCWTIPERDGIELKHHRALGF